MRVTKVSTPVVRPARTVDEATFTERRVAQFSVSFANNRIMLRSVVAPYREVNGVGEFASEGAVEYVEDITNKTTGLLDEAVERIEARIINRLTTQGVI